MPCYIVVVNDVKVECELGLCRTVINRRQFMIIAAGCAAGLAGSGALAGAKWPLVDIGTLKDFVKDGIFIDFTKDDFFVMRRQGVLFAASTVCPHMGNTLRRDPQDPGRIICSGHESNFDDEGAVTVGPATSGLLRFGISVDDKGRIIVNRNLEFPQEKWTEKGCFIEIK